MQPEDLANAFATFADKVDMMSEVVDRFNTKLAEFNTVETATVQAASEEEEAPQVPPPATVEETASDIPNSVLSLVEALNTWKGE